MGFIELSKEENEKKRLDGYKFARETSEPNSSNFIYFDEKIKFLEGKGNVK